MFKLYSSTSQFIVCIRINLGAPKNSKAQATFPANYVVPVSQAEIRPLVDPQSHQLTVIERQFKDLLSQTKL